jgi:hypothetical protein
MKRILWTIVATLVAVPASAQSPYVAGTIGTDVIRSTSATFAGLTNSSSNGEAWNLAIRAGSFLAPRAGVEIELLRPAASRIDDDRVYIAANRSLPPIGGTDAAVTVPAVSIFPPPVISSSLHVRTTTLSTLAFARQSIGARADLVYLGGLGFSRVVHETELGTPGGSLITRTIQYGVGPVVGAEARIGMTTHVRLVAGIRLHSLGQSLLDGWLVRPGIGLSWSF